MFVSGFFSPWKTPKPVSSLSKLYTSASYDECHSKQISVDFHITLLFAAHEITLSSAQALGETASGVASLTSSANLLTWSLPAAVWRKERLAVKMGVKNQKCSGSKVRGLEEKAAEGLSSEASLVGLLVGNLFAMDNLHFFWFTSGLSLTSLK